MNFGTLLRKPLLLLLLITPRQYSRAEHPAEENDGFDVVIDEAAVETAMGGGKGKSYSVSVVSAVSLSPLFAIRSRRSFVKGKMSGVIGRVHRALQTQGRVCSNNY